MAGSAGALLWYRSSSESKPRESMQKVIAVAASLLASGVAVAQPADVNVVPDEYKPKKKKKEKKDKD
jgi:hypothetical protein